MKTPASFFQGLMAKVRSDLYKGRREKEWFSSQKMIKKALMHPAACLAKYQVEISAERYQAILEDIINTVARHGNLDNVGYMGRYFLYCVQEHMKHHGDRYYQEGKAVNNRVSLVMSAVERAHKGADGTIPVLAQADALLQLGKRKAKVKPVPADTQPTLL